MSTTQQTILDFIRSRHPRLTVEADQDIFQLGFVNSLFAMELVMFVEKEFALTVPTDELRIDNFRSADAMTALVERLQPVPETVG